MSVIDFSPIKRFFSLPSEQIASRFVASQLGTPLLVIASSLPLLSIHFFPQELPFKASMEISGACLLGAIAIHLSYQAVISFNNGESFDLKMASLTTRRLFHQGVKYFNLINTSTMALYGLQRAHFINPILISSPLICIISSVIGLALFILSSALKYYFPKNTTSN